MLLGLDIGSCYTKGVILNGDIQETRVTKTALRPRQAIDTLKNDLRGYKKIGATGYGRDFVQDATVTVTEISAFARGANFIYPSARTIIDIGGQDSKIIKIRKGKVDRFIMNDRCAAGTGNFIEKIAFSLNLSLTEFGDLAVRSLSPETIDSLCVVMAESEILSLVSEGKPLEDILAGVCDSIIRRILSIGDQIEIEEPILFCGGGALNPGLVKSIQRFFTQITVPKDPQFIGAIGAALYAAG